MGAPAPVKAPKSAPVRPPRPPKVPARPPKKRPKPVKRFRARDPDPLTAGIVPIGNIIVPIIGKLVDGEREIVREMLVMPESRTGLRMNERIGTRSSLLGGAP
jgi:hypothetical protein